MDDTEQLIQKQRQCVDAYNHIRALCDMLLQEIKILDGIIEASPSCYSINDTNLCGKYVSDIQSRLVTQYNYMARTVLPQTKALANNYQQAILSSKQ